MALVKCPRCGLATTGQNINGMCAICISEFVTQFTDINGIQCPNVDRYIIWRNLNLISPELATKFVEDWVENG